MLPAISLINPLYETQTQLIWVSGLGAIQNNNTNLVMVQQLQRDRLLLLQATACFYHEELVLQQLLVLLLLAYLYLELDHDKWNYFLSRRLLAPWQFLHWMVCTLARPKYWLTQKLWLTNWVTINHLDNIFQRCLSYL